VIISINISEEQVKHAEQLARHRRMTTGESANRSSEIGRAIDALFLTECLTDKTNDVSVVTPVKLIIPIFETIGKRRKLVGFDAFYGDQLVGRFDTQRDAEKALDAWVYEELAA
jgi:hypothetical protein